MKNFRVIFALLALLLAFGGALASKSNVAQTFGYEWNGAVCVLHNLQFECNPNGEDPCEVSVGSGTVHLKEIDDSQTMCGQFLYRID